MPSPREDHIHRLRVMARMLRRLSFHLENLADELGRKKDT